MSNFFSKLLVRMQQRLPPPPIVPDPTSSEHLRDVFALQVRSLLGAVGVHAEYDPGQFSLRMDQGRVSRLANLTNQFYEYAHAAPEDREGIVLHVARGIRDACRPSPIAVGVEGARSFLRPRIRHRAHLAILRLQRDGASADEEGDEGEGVFLPISTDLGAEVVYDTPANIVSLPADQLARWGLSGDEALAVAIANLRAAGPEPFRLLADGVYVAAVGDCYDSARLLLVDEIAALPLNGPAVALPANRDTLVITGERHLGGLYRLLEVALQAIERPRTDTLQPVVLSHGAWREWLPPQDHPMWEAFYELSVITRGECYAAVRRALAAQHERDGLDVVVSSFGMIVRTEGDLPLSHAVWPPGPGWLPEADLVTVIHPQDERYILVPWPKLRQHAHHLLRKVPEVHPPYFAFGGAPDERVWERLRAHAVREGIVSQRPRAAAAR